MKENDLKKKTKDIQLSEFIMSDYLSQNRNKRLSEVIFQSYQRLLTLSHGKKGSIRMVLVSCATLK